jgi:hypothetical protein
MNNYKVVRIWWFILILTIPCITLDKTGSGTGLAITAKTNSSKLHLVKQLVEKGRSLDAKYLSASDKTHFARGVSAQTAARVRPALDDVARKLEAAVSPPPVQSSAAPQPVGSKKARTFFCE